jgi:hypothetical protein
VSEVVAVVAVAVAVVAAVVVVVVVAMHQPQPLLARGGGSEVMLLTPILENREEKLYQKLHL